jgi:hypothetical protein
MDTALNLFYVSSIRNYAISLLSSNTMKRTLPYAIDSISNFDILFRNMIDRIYLGKVPKYFIGIYNLLYKWKYFVWVSSRFNRKYTEVPLLQFEKV